MSVSGTVERGAMGGLMPAFARTMSRWVMGRDERAVWAEVGDVDSIVMWRSLEPGPEGRAARAGDGEELRVLAMTVVFGRRR